MYQFNAVRFGRDITANANSLRGIANILARWLVWDEDGGLMRCSPDSLTYKGVEILDSRELYRYSHGSEVAVLRLLCRRVKAIDGGA